MQHGLASVLHQSICAALVVRPISKARSLASPHPPVPSWSRFLSEQKLRRWDRLVAWKSADACGHPILLVRVGRALQLVKPERMTDFIDAVLSQVRRLQHMLFWEQDGFYSTDGFLKSNGFWMLQYRGQEIGCVQGVRDNSADCCPLPLWRVVRHLRRRGGGRGTTALGAYHAPGGWDVPCKSSSSTGIKLGPHNRLLAKAEQEKICINLSTVLTNLRASLNYITLVAWPGFSQITLWFINGWPSPFSCDNAGWLPQLATTKAPHLGYQCSILGTTGAQCPCTQIGRSSKLVVLVSCTETHMTGTWPWCTLCRLTVEL
jgi:hypothetical protein